MLIPVTSFNLPVLLLLPLALESAVGNVSALPLQCLHLCSLLWEGCKSQKRAWNMQRFQLGALGDCLLLFNHPDCLQLEVLIPKEHGGSAMRHLSPQEFWKYPLTTFPYFLQES